MSTEKTMIACETEVNAPIETVWELWTAPEHIMQWNNTSADWHNLNVENDLREGGKFLFAMAMKDGSQHFDFAGAYTEVKPHEAIAYILDDNRTSRITFTGSNPVKVTENFEPESSMPVEMQKGFCQAVLDNFKRYTEGNLK